MVLQRLQHGCIAGDDVLDKTHEVLVLADPVDLHCEGVDDELVEALPCGTSDDLGLVGQVLGQTSLDDFGTVGGDVFLDRRDPAAGDRRADDRAVAEATLAGMLAWLRRLPPLLTAQPQRRWIKPDVEPEIGALDGSQGVNLARNANHSQALVALGQ